MLKRNIIIIIIITLGMIIPLAVIASTQNSLNLSNNVTVQAGETASFYVSVGLTNLLDQNVTKIEFEISKDEELTGLIEYALAGPNSLFFNSPEANKFIVTKGPKTTDIITDGDIIAKLSIPVNTDCPEGDIVVTIKNVKITYLPDVDSSSSSSSSTENTPIIVDGLGSVKTITVEKKLLSNIAELKSLSFSTGVPSPTFAPNVYEYNIELKDTVKSTTITAECNENCSSINGDTSPWSQKIVFAEGETQEIEIKVISENLKNSEKYLITISRGPISQENAKLKSLSITDATLDPEFSSDKFNYYLSVPNEIDKVEVIYELNDSTASAVVAGESALIAGEENAVTIVVTSEDEKNELTYTIYVSRAEATSSSSTSTVISSASSDDSAGTNKYTLIGLIIAGSLAIIGAAFYLLFKAKKGKKIKKIKIDPKVKPDIAISHDHDIELLELTREYNGLPEQLEQIKKNDDNDLPK